MAEKISETLNIQRVISTSTSSVSIDDLNKKGFKQVKVLNHAVIAKLIGEAVDRVLEERSKSISRDEREKVIKEAKSQFETLAKRKLDKERHRIEELEVANASLSSELDTVKKRFAASIEIQVERDQAVQKAEGLTRELGVLRAETARLQAELAQSGQAVEGFRSTAEQRDGETERLRKDLEELRAQLAGTQTRANQGEARFAALNAELEKARAEALAGERSRLEAQASQARALELERRIEDAQARLDALQSTVSEKDRECASLSGQLSAKSEELDRLIANGPPSSVSETLLAAVAERLQGASGSGDVKGIMSSLESLSRKLETISRSSGASSAEDLALGNELAVKMLFDKDKDGAVESNLTRVKVKESSAKDVKSALARLKKLQSEGSNG